MKVIFPSQPFEPRIVDSAFAREQRDAAAAGLATALVDSDAIDEGRYDAAVRGITSTGETELAVYRGWMMRVEDYAKLHEALTRRGVVLVNSPEQYRSAHHFPDGYPHIAGHTPKSVWTTTGAEVDLDTLMSLLGVFGRSSLIVKDFVKSQKHYWHEACFIPDASDREAVSRVVRKFVELQDSSLTGGLVFREFIELDALTTHSKSGMPLTKEYRLFFLDGKVLSSAEYWEEGNYEADRPNLAKFEALARKIPSRFFTMDVARTREGDWIVMELGDGQVSGLPERLDVSTFYGALALAAPGLVSNA